jgi:hypothetical protein
MLRWPPADRCYRFTVRLVIALIVASAGVASGDSKENQIERPDRPRFGPRVGVFMATVDGDSATAEVSKRIGLDLGGAVLLPIGEHFGIEGGLAYVQKGAAPLSGFGSQLRLDYIQLAVVGVGSVRIGPTARARASLGGTLNVNVYAKEGQEDLMAETSNVDAGAVGGLGIELDTEAGMILLEVRYEHGLTDVADRLRHRVVAASAAFMF